MSIAYLSLGSNMGDRGANLRFALKSLAEQDGIQPLRGSAIYETSAWGPVEQDNFLNACIELETTLSPDELLTVCQKIELAAGRRREVRWGPRTLDIDILLYDDLTIDTPRLAIPHPRMKERMFVLVPLMELEETVPVLGPLAELLESLPPQGLIARTDEQWLD